MQNAFSKVILVVMASGKVHAEVNTTLEEQVHMDEELDTASHLKVIVLFCFTSFVVIKCCLKAMWMDPRKAALNQGDANLLTL